VSFSQFDPKRKLAALVFAESQHCSEVRKSAALAVAKPWEAALLTGAVCGLNPLVHCRSSSFKLVREKICFAVVGRL
jgi:hypothetical protein